jgi:hypothetical protein
MSLPTPASNPILFSPHCDDIKRRIQLIDACHHYASQRKSFLNFNPKCEKDSNDGVQLWKIYIKLISNDKNNTKFNISLALRLKIMKLSQRNPLIKMCKIYTLNCTSIFAHFYSIDSLYLNEFFQVVLVSLEFAVDGIIISTVTWIISHEVKSFMFFNTLEERWA